MSVGRGHIVKLECFTRWKFANTIVVGVEVAKAIEDVVCFVDVLSQAPVVVGRLVAHRPDVARRNAGRAVTDDDEFVTVDCD
jgi:hypothetical protein